MIQPIFVSVAECDHVNDVLFEVTTGNLSVNLHCSKKTICDTLLTGHAHNEHPTSGLRIRGAREYSFDRDL